MPIKDILVGLATRSEDDRARDFALSMGAKFGAQVTAIAYALEPQVPFSPFPGFTADLIERHRSEAKKEAELARGGPHVLRNRRHRPLSSGRLRSEQF